jgi:hypothetical protein
VWHLSNSCPADRKVGIAVRLREVTLYRRSVRTCQVIRGHGPKDDLLKFTFRSRADLSGAEFRSLGTRSIEGNIWKAGGEKDAMLLGVSLASKDQVLLNAIHIADARQTSITVLAPDLAITTSGWER